MAKKHTKEYTEAIERLREWLPPGSTLYTILEHVSRSGMTRTIRTVIPYTLDDGSIDHLHPNHAIATITDSTRDKKRAGVKVGGCGMDMGFHLVSTVGSILYGGRRCDCGSWYDATGTRRTQEEHNNQKAHSDTDRWAYKHTPSCPACAGSGHIIGTGYQCLGKGKCPSNYHTNYRYYRPDDGPERFDLEHFDGEYAIRHRWL
jgi:hypothetical protein